LLAFDSSQAHEYSSLLPGFAMPGTFGTHLLYYISGPFGHTYDHMVSSLLWLLSHLQRGHAICLVSAYLWCVSSSPNPPPLPPCFGCPHGVTVSHSWRMSRTVELSGSEFSFHVGGLAEIQAALLVTLSCQSLLSMTCACCRWHRVSTER
jgi:hypothetical protein